MDPTVLIVEDEAAIVTMLRYNLEREGMQVVEAGDGDEALKILAETHVDLVLLDWMLPGLSGIELCRRLRAREDTERLPVIMLTGYTERRKVEEARDAGITEFLAKPVSARLLSVRRLCPRQLCPRRPIRRPCPQRLCPRRLSPQPLSRREVDWDERYINEAQRVLYRQHR